MEISLCARKELGMPKEEWYLREGEEEGPEAALETRLQHLVQFEKTLASFSSYVSSVVSA